MKIRLNLLFFSAFLIFSGCMYFEYVPVKQSDYFNKVEFKMLELSAATLGMGYGYNPDLDMNYLYTIRDEDKLVESIDSLTAKGGLMKDGRDMEKEQPPKNPSQTPQKAKDIKDKKAETKSESKDKVTTTPTLTIADKNFERFSTELDRFDDSDIISFYVKMYRLYEITEYYQEYFRQKKKWTNYNQVRINWIDTIKIYMDNLDKYCQTKKEKIYPDMLQQKEGLKKEAALYCQKKFRIVEEY